MTNTPPAVRPARPYFSSGPCAKPPGWSPDQIDTRILGLSHRSGLGKERLKLCIDLMREMLELPDTHRIGIVPGSDTGAFEMAMWTMLGAKPVTCLAWESFGEGWVTDAVKQLKLDPTVMRADYGELPDLGQADWSNDVLFTWNGTTSGVRVPDGDWISETREGLTIADATSAAFAMDLPWDKLDVTTYSWQKVLGGEGAHGMIILSPRAIARLESYKPSWPLPKIFRLTSGGKLIEGIFKGETINTPSMLCVEDYIDTLQWAESIGGLSALRGRANANAKAVLEWVAKTPWIENLSSNPAAASNTSVCLKLVDPAVKSQPAEAQIAFVKQMESLLDKEGVAFDIANHRDAPASLRIWCGCTVETSDVAALMPWLDWAFAEAKATLAKAA